MARTWRKESVKSAGGSTWRLTTGRNELRVRVGLGQVTEEQADAALFAMNHFTDNEEKAVLALYDERPLDARKLLLGDPGELRMLPAPAIDYGAMTVAEYFDRVYAPARKDRSSPIGVSARTWKEEERYWRHTGRMPYRQQGERPKRGILDGVIGGTRMRDLDDQLWERWQAAQTHLSPRSKAIRRNAYAALLSYARRMGHLTYRPEFFRLRGATKRTREQSDPLTLDEVMKLLAVADPTRRAMWAIGVGQGLRPGELVRMRWEDVDWEARTMLVRGTKTEDSWDTIPMTPLAYRELREFHLRQGRPVDGLCFTLGGFGTAGRAADGRVKKSYTAPRGFVSYRKALASDAKAAGITRKVTPYLLRHSFATLAFLLGVEKDVARRIGRWSTEDMLDQVYCRPRPRDLVEKLARFDVG